MGNQESEVLGKYVIENCRDVHVFVVINFKSIAYKIIIYVVHKITEKNVLTNKMYFQKTQVFLLIFFKHNERYSHVIAIYYNYNFFLYSLSLNIMIACSLAFLSEISS